MKLSYIFPGQGSQVVGMGKDFYDSSNVAREMFEQASDALKIDFKNLLFEQNDKLDETEFSQPAILLVSLVAHKLFENQTSSLALGHSLGEFSALVSVGALNFEDGIKLVHERGLLMKSACKNQDAGMMAVIGLEIDKLSTLCKEFQASNKKVWIANINNHSQIVLAGTKSDLSSIETTLKENGAKRAILLPMSVASHCPLLEPITEQFGKLLHVNLKDSFKTAIISNVTAHEYRSKNEAVNLLQNQLISPVEYVKSIELAEQKSDCFIEFGATVLKGLNRRITKKPTLSITDMKSLETTLKEVNL